MTRLFQRTRRTILYSRVRSMYSQQLGFRQGASERVEEVYTQYMTDDERDCNTAENSSAKSILAVVGFLLISGCTDPENMAPVVQSRWLVQNRNQSAHRVQPGETLYAIAFRYDKDYRQLAVYNHLQSPYSLRVGQVVRLPHTVGQPKPAPYKPWSTPHSVSQAKPAHLAYTSPHQAGYTHSVGATNGWRWPAQGRVVANFVPSQGKKGIDIACNKGEGVYASASGIVAYAGSGLMGYGNLIIIKHNNQYLTAYGNNSKNWVHEGQQVSVGQKIAEVGLIDRRFWGVHFEIRQAGQPVNPLNYLGQHARAG